MIVCEAAVDLGFPTLVWLPECKAVREAVVDLGFTLDLGLPTLAWLPRAACEAVVDLGFPTFVWEIPLLSSGRIGLSAM